MKKQVFISEFKNMIDHELQKELPEEDSEILFLKTSLIILAGKARHVITAEEKTHV